MSSVETQLVFSFRGASASEGDKFCFD